VALRRELLIREDGQGVSILDPLTDRTWVYSVEELASERVDPVLLEGPVSEVLRAQVWARNSRPSAPVFEVEDFDWGVVSELPSEVSVRDPEVWRRLAEQRLAGDWILRVPGFTEWTPDQGDEERLDTELVHAWRVRAEAPLFSDPVVRQVCGAVLGIRLEGPVECNRWRMQAGDGILSHRVGRRYAATFTLGLNRGWTAADGGAIAFGDPSTGVVTDRWLPHAGDLCLFAGGEHSWHWVEAPRRERHTLTGWWTY